MLPFGSSARKIVVVELSALVIAIAPFGIFAIELSNEIGIPTAFASPSLPKDRSRLPSIN
jgi:hypothetical protein